MFLQKDMNYDGSSYNYNFTIIFNTTILIFGSTRIICDTEYDRFCHCYKKVDTKRLISKIVESPNNVNQLINTYTKDFQHEDNISTFKEFLILPSNGRINLI